MVGAEGFYAINNPFLVNGPKGYIEFKTLENEDMYIRFDVPGVPNNGVNVILDQSNKAVCILGDAPKEHKYDASVRSYNGTTLRKKLSIGGFPPSSDPNGIHVFTRLQAYVIHNKLN